MTDITAAIGLAQLDRYPELLEKRKGMIAQYDKALKPMGIEVLDHYRNDRTSSGHLYIIRILGATREQCNDIITKMAEQGVATNVHYKPLPLHTAYKKLGFDIKDYPNAYAKFENEITLPLHTRMTEDDVDYVCNAFKEAYGGVFNC